MKRCILCSADAYLERRPTACGGMGGTQYTCDTCGDFLFCDMSLYKPDGQQDQTPAVLAALRHALATANQKITEKTGRVVQIYISTDNDDEDKKTREHVNENQKFPQNTIEKGFTIIDK